MNTMPAIISRFKAALTRKRLLWGGAGMSVALFVFMMIPESANACGLSDIPGCGAQFLVWLLQLLTALMGNILVLEIDALIRVVQYNNFVAPGPTAVAVGWVVTRDLANMFFIIFMLIIAFDTIIRGGDSTYGYRKTLRRLLIMAIVINFSKTICGIFIDMSQVLLLSFVNGFKAAAAGNFFTAFGINKLLDLAKDGGDYKFGMVLAMLFAFIIATIAACIMLIMLVMMLFRIVTLWVLIILSPIAFLTSSFPLSSTNYYADWWKMFKANLTSGPIVAFFIWLALAVAQGGGSVATDHWQPSSTASQQEQAGRSTFQGTSIPTAAADGSDTILSLLITISILLAGLKTASEQPVAGAGFAKNVRGKVEGALKGIARAPLGFAGGALQNVGGRAMKGAGTGLARVPIVGGLGRRMAMTGDKLVEDRRKKVEAKYGGAKELAKYSPSKFGSTLRLRTATDAQIKETADLAATDPKAMAALQKAGGSAMVRDRMKKMADKDPTANKAGYDKYMASNWQGAVDDQGNMTADARKKVLKKHTGDDAKKFIAAEDFDEEVAGSLSKEALVEYLNKGNEGQKTKAVEVLNGMSDADRGKLFREKRMDHSDISAETFKMAGTKADNLRRGALAQAEGNPAVMKKFVDDPLMRDELKGMAATNVGTATEGPDRAKKRMMAMMLGSNNGPQTLAEEQEMAMLSAKDVSDMDKNAPIDDAAIQAAINKGVTAALKHGTSAMAQAIKNSPTLSMRASVTDLEDAEKSTNDYTSRLNRQGSEKRSILNSQRKTAVTNGASTAAIDTSLASLDSAVIGVKNAMKDLGTAELAFATEQGTYAREQKNRNQAGMQASFNRMTIAVANVAAKKADVAVSNATLKNLT